MSQVLLTRKRKHIAERGTARKRGAGFDPGLRRLESEARESPVCGWQAKIPKVLRLPPPAADSSCALWVIHRMRYLPFQKMGRESSFYVNFVPKSFFFLEFLERLLDSSKYSFKSHWSICYSATVIAAGGGRFLTRCTHARTPARTRRPGTAIFQRQGRAAPAVWSLYLIIWSWGLWLILLRASKTTPPPLLVYYL